MMGRQRDIKQPIKVVLRFLEISRTCTTLSAIWFMARSGATWNYYWVSPKLGDFYYKSESEIPEIDNALTQFVEIEQENVQQTPKPATPVAAELQSQPAIQIEAFELQAVSLATCLIVLDASQLTKLNLVLG